MQPSANLLILSFLFAHTAGITMSLETPSKKTQDLLSLARHDRAQARAQMRNLSHEEQLARVCDAPLSRRAEILDLSPSPELLIPELPEAELCFIVKQVGLADAAWILAHATREQIIACLDLDIWQKYSLEPARVETWLAALAEAGDEVLFMTAQAMDLETLTLFLRDRIIVELKANDDDWQAPPGSETLEGQFYFRARHDHDDLATIKQLLHALFQGDYWLYFRTMQAVMHELPTETEEWALRWRSGRLQDLGFVPREEAIRIYAYLPLALRTQQDDMPLETSEWTLPIWMPRFPETTATEPLIFRAAAHLDAEARRGFFFQFLNLANKVAVADDLALSDAETISKTLAKAAELSSAGLEWLSVECNRAPGELLREVSLEKLFRIGVSNERDRKHTKLSETD